MNDTTRRWVWPAVGLVLVATVAGGLIARGERRIADGRVLFLELVAVDPRALLQGDYMALDYRVAVDARDVLQAGTADRPRLSRPTPGAPATLVPANGHIPGAGHLVLAVDDRGVGHFRRFAGPAEALAADELLLDYDESSLGISVGSNAWYFQEGDADLYSRARFAEYRVLPDGSAVLVGLRDEVLQPLGRPAR